MSTPWFDCAKVKSSLLGSTSDEYEIIYAECTLWMFYYGKTPTFEFNDVDEYEMILNIFVRLWMVFGKTPPFEII